MDKDLMNISAIEDFLRKKLYKNVSNNIFFGNEPETMQSSWTDFVVVDCSSSINDMRAYGRGTISILLYANKNMSNGSKNRSVLNDLESKLNKVIEGNTDEHYTITKAGGMGDYNPTNKLYYNVVFITISVY